MRNVTRYKKKRIQFDVSSATTDQLHIWCKIVLSSESRKPIHHTRLYFSCLTSIVMVIEAKATWMHICLTVCYLLHVYAIYYEGNFELELIYSIFWFMLLLTLSTRRFTAADGLIWRSWSLNQVLAITSHLQCVCVVTYSASTKPTALLVFQYRRHLHI